MKKTVVFDFDGVIHSYVSGWKGSTVIPDPPVPGIAEAIQQIRRHYAVAVVSTRCATQAGADAVRAWLDKHGIEVDSVQKEKPPAVVYIDDRAICFDGNPAALLSKIQMFEVWNKKLTVSDQAQKQLKEIRAYESKADLPAWSNLILGKFNRVV